MLAKLLIEGREFPIEIQDPELQKLLVPKKNNGYERVVLGQRYFYDVLAPNRVEYTKDIHDDIDNESYEIANYYSDKTVAENNARADKLMRQLRRFAVEHREQPIMWGNGMQQKWLIGYSWMDNELYITCTFRQPYCGVIYFDFQETAELALQTFHDELIWYFTEYKDSL